MRAEDFLLEIGTEELPPTSLHQLMTSLQDNLCQELQQRGFVHGETKAFGTPRRLAVIIKELAQWQPDQKIEKRGPSLKAAYSDNGKPTKALLGFARSCQVENPDTLEQLVTDKGEWVVYRETRPGNSIAHEIEGIINKAVGRIPIARRMRWGAFRTEFVRPVHWVVALYGTDILDANILGQQSNRYSFGHRFMHPDEIHLASPDQYVQLCREASVIVDFEERRALINEDLKQIAERFNARIDPDQELLDEVTSLVEWPVVLTGSFDEKYLKIPDDVLISAMRKHQRYFHMRNQQGNLLARFVAVANIVSKDESAIIQGNERVISPRLADAAFFFHNDTRSSLARKVEQLEQVVFQTRLGTYYKKAVRVSHLAGQIASLLDTDVDCATRAGLLCKADLVSDLVGEFPDLQGVMGAHYAKWDNEPPEVCEAIRTHYYPTAAGADLPVGKLSSSVAIADKLDTLTGIFGIGQSPTGSRDPFSLRRQALGIIRIIIENSLELDLQDCLEKASDQYPSRFDIQEVYQYIIERLTHWYQEQGIDNDVISAILRSSAGITDLSEADRRIRKLQAFRHHDRASDLVAAHKRVANILKQVSGPPQVEIDTRLFEHEAEGELFQAIILAEKAFSNTIDYQERLLILADQQNHIDRYFDDVLIMSENADIRQNRLAVMRRMRQLFLLVADFSLLQN
ncbi:MAG: glycine--tRNA ligase subunit beta [Gammaproteobacteria bacterium]|nr:glycine--tRNA ligase subunit beta [Gammaproteobacteria bacterium]